MIKYFKSLIPKNIPSKISSLSPKAIIWNKFIETVCYKDISNLTPIQRTAFLVFWYDAEMGSGGHSGYFDCYPETNIQELIKALEDIEASFFAKNLEKAMLDGEKDDYQETDRIFYQLTPDIFDILMNYVLINEDEIFD